MLSKNTIKYIRSLHQKKFRQKYNKFIVEGDKIAKEILISKTLKVEAIYSTFDWCKNNEYLLNENELPIQEVTTQELKKISTLKTPNQVLLIANIPNIVIDNQQLSRGFSIYLDAIQDPGNLGTILRIADWFGIEHVFLSDKCVELYNPKVIQATMGAFLRVKVIQDSLLELNKSFPELPIYAAVLNGKNIHDIQADKGIIVIGNEARGIDFLKLPQQYEAITIPKGKNGQAESLNAAVACGIICSTFVRF